MSSGSEATGKLATELGNILNKTLNENGVLEMLQKNQNKVAVKAGIEPEPKTEDSNFNTKGIVV